VTNLVAHSENLTELGHDERFRRIRTLYLANCEGGFAERRICGIQLLLAKPLWAVKAGARVRSSVIAVADSA
jgi:hypothetical protein